MSGAAGLALGTVQWGLPYGIANRTGRRPTLEEVHQMLALARPWVKYLDTARAYGDSERVIGQATGGDTHWTILTKLHPDANISEQVAASLQASRQALCRNRLDALLLHRWTHRATVWDFLRRERDAGCIGELGASALNPDEAWQMLDDPEVQVIQVATNLFDQRLSRAGFFEQALAARKTVFVRSVFLQGVGLLPPEELPSPLTMLVEPIRLLRQWAAKQGLSSVVPFLAFAASLPGVWVLIGCESAQQLQTNLSEWETACQHLDTIGELAESIPELPAALVNPAMWESL